MKKTEELLSELEQAFTDMSSFDMSKDANIAAISNLASLQLEVDMKMAHNIASEVFDSGHDDFAKHVWKMYEVLCRERFLISYIGIMRSSYSKDEAAIKGEKMASQFFRSPGGTGGAFN